MNYALIKSVDTSYEETIEKTKAALQAQGFGVLSEINVSGVLKAKLDVDHPRTLILGACNPKFAHETLNAEADISVFLPCNVVVRENKAGGVEVVAMNPDVMANLAESPDVAGIASQVTARIQAALAAL